MLTTKPSVLVGLIGHSIQGSLAPELHMAEGERLGLRYLYTFIDLERLGLGLEALGGLILAAERMGYNGLTITHPCKQAVMPLLTGFSEAAQSIGAVNTIVLKEGRREGHNTDWIGFAESFRAELAGVRTERVVMIGAGGAGHAVGYALLSLGVRRLIIHDLEAERAGALAERLNGVFSGGRAEAYQDIAKALQAADGLVNATWTGMDAHPGCPVPPALLRPDLFVADLIYFPAETALLKAARRLGARTMNGGGMMVRQANAQIRLFAGREPDLGRVLADFEAIRQDRPA